MISPPNHSLSPSVAALLGSCVGAPDEEKLFRIWEEYRLSAECHVCVHMEGEEVVGLIGVKRNVGGPTIIRHIAIEPRYQRKGVGRRLIDQLPDAELRAETDAEAVEFYRHCGFSVRSLGEKYPGVERFECVRKRSNN